MKSLDVFGIPVTLYYKKKERFHTLLGSFMTLIMFSLIFASFIFFSKDMYLRINPSISYQEESSDNNTKINLNSRDNVFGLFFEHETTLKRKLDVSAIYLEINTINQTFNSYPIELENCSSLQNGVKTVFRFSEGYCLKTFDRNLTGYFLDTHSSYIFMSVSLCNNKTKSKEEPLCLPKEDILEEIAQMKFALAYYENLILPFDYENPINKKISVYWNYLDITRLNQYDILFKEGKVETDEGVIFPSVKIISTPMVDNVEQRSVPLVSSQGREMDFFFIQFRKASNQLRIRREYKKIQYIFAEVGGIIKFAMLTGKLSIILLNRKIFHLDLVNTFYSLDETLEVTPPQKEEILIRNKKNSDHTSNLSSPSRNSFNTNLTKLNRETLDYLSKNKETFNYKTSELIITSFCPKFCIKNKKTMKKELILHNAYLDLRDKIDVTYLIRSFFEIKLVKSFILNESQIKIMNYLRKEPINIMPGNCKIKNHLLATEEKNKKVTEISQIISYYRNNRNNLTSIDEKLFEYLDKDLQKLYINSYKEV